MHTFLTNRCRRGSALISTLLVIAVLAIIVTAFLQSMAIERQTARSYVERVRAEMAAYAGISEVMTKLSTATGASGYHYAVETVNPGTDTEHLRVLTLAPGAKTVASTTDLSASGSEKTTQIPVVKSGLIKRTSELVELPGPLPDETAAFAYWVDEENAKQDLLTRSGAETPRRQLSGLKLDGASGAWKPRIPFLAELPLVSRSGTPLTTPQRTAVDSEQKNVWAQTAAKQSLVTPATLNQLLKASGGITPDAENYDFTLAPRTRLLTPLGQPRLNLNRLKRYIDGGFYQEFDDRGLAIDIEGRPSNYAALSLAQGPTSPRFLLIKQLLNETGQFPATAENPWGPGNLEFVLRMLPERDAAGEPTQARQFVANLIDYIDSDIIPTTDGTPTPAPTAWDADNSTAQRLDNPQNLMIVAPRTVTTSPPLPNRPPAPTVFGVEGRVNGNKVVGHPYIAAISSGFIFNPTGGGTQINSTRILAHFAMVNPWEGEINWQIGNAAGGGTGYLAEVQATVTGNVVNGANGPALYTPGTGSGYFRNAWLAQNSGYPVNAGAASGPFTGQKVPGYTGFNFPRAWTGDNDMSNGPYRINQPITNTNRVRFDNFGLQLDLVRLIYRKGGQRYLVQDLSCLTTPNFERKWNPSTYLPQPGNLKNPGQLDWHLNGDPRLNFLASSWNQKVSTISSGLTVPSIRNAIYTTPVNPRKDGLETMDDGPTWWRVGGASHFPTYALGYRPSPLGGDEAANAGLPDEPAMLSVSEFGFLHSGRPWQTLTLFNDGSRFSPPYANADWQLLDYIDLGNSPRKLEQNLPEIAGQTNVNAGKQATLQALFTDLPTAVDPTDLATKLRNSPRRPFLAAADILEDPLITNQGSTESRKEQLIGQLYPALTNRSQSFTVYAVGESRRNGLPVSRVLLRAEISLEPDSAGTIVPTIKQVTTL